MTISKDTNNGNRHSGTSGTVTVGTSRGNQCLVAMVHMVGEINSTSAPELDSITNSNGLVWQRRMRYANPQSWCQGPGGGSANTCNAVEVWWAWSSGSLSGAVQTFNYDSSLNGGSVTIAAYDGTFGSPDQTPWPDQDPVVNSFASLTPSASSIPTGTFDTIDADNFVMAIYGGASSGNINLSGGSTGWTVVDANNGNPKDFSTTLDIWSKDVSGPTSGVTIAGDTAYPTWIWVMDYLVPVVTDAVAPDLPAQTQTPSSTGTAGIGYTTTRDDEIMLLAVAHESNQVNPSWVSSVTDTNGLTWTRRARVTNVDSRATSAELWWAAVPTAMSGTITVNYSPNIDNGTLTTIGFFNTDTSAPWDTDPSLPGLAFNTVNSSSVIEATVSTKADIGYLLGFSSVGVAEGVGTPGGFTQIAAPHNSGGVQWCFSNLFGQEIDAPQSSNTVSTGNNFSQWAFIVDALAKKSSAPPQAKPPIVNFMNG